MIILGSIDTIRLAGVIPESYTDGVGIRYTIFVQGCNHKCEECQNPETWDFNGGNLYSIDELVGSILENPLLDGITLSGGDPMYSTKPVIELINRLKNKRTDLNIWLYTGFTFEECLADKNRKQLLKLVDVLVDGTYQKCNRSLHLRFRGSSNQRIIDVQKSLKDGKIHILIDD